MTLNSNLRMMLATGALAAISPALAAARPSPYCGTVAFAPQSDNGAFEIVAQSTTCRTARTVAGASRLGRFRSGNPRYEADGFSCSGTSEQVSGQGKQVVRFRCTRRQSSVSFYRG